MFFLWLKFKDVMGFGGLKFIPSLIKFSPRKKRDRKTEKVGQILRQTD
jgi:hypothetical protein